MKRAAGCWGLGGRGWGLLGRCTCSIASTPPRGACRRREPSERRSHRRPATGDDPPTPDGWCADRGASPAGEHVPRLRKRGCLDTLRESQKSQSRRKCETCARAPRVKVAGAVGGMCESVCSAGFGPRGHATSRAACGTCSEPAQTPKHVFVRGGFLLHFIVFHLTACDVNMTYAAGSAGMARAGAVV